MVSPYCREYVSFQPAEALGQAGDFALVAVAVCDISLDQASACDAPHRQHDDGFSNWAPLLSVSHLFLFAFGQLTRPPVRLEPTLRC